MWGVGGQKFSLRMLQAVGKLNAPTNRRLNGNAADAKFLVGGSNLGRLTVGGRGGSAGFTRPGFEPPTKKLR